MPTIKLKFEGLSPAQVRKATQDGLWASARKSVDVVRRRTAAGKGPDGNPRRPYTKAYQLRRAAAGKSVNVDSVWAGVMFGGLRPLAVDSANGRFSFGATGKAGVMAYHTNLDRPFLGIQTEQDLKYVAKAFESAFNKSIKAQTK